MRSTQRNPPTLCSHSKRLLRAPAVWQVLFQMLWPQRLKRCGFSLAVLQLGKRKGGRRPCPRGRRRWLQDEGCNSSNQPRTTQETSFPENSLHNTEYQFSLWLFPPRTEITEPVTQNTAHSVVGKNRKHPKGRKASTPCARKALTLAGALPGADAPRVQHGAPCSAPVTKATAFPWKVPKSFS